jgi:hypothetical protein
MTITTIRAGNIAHIDRTFTRVDPAVSVIGSTAAVAVTDAAGTTTALTGETVTVDNTAGTVRVVADWTIPDNYPRQIVTVTIDVSTAMIAAYEQRIFVQSRTLATVP